MLAHSRGRQHREPGLRSADRTRQEPCSAPRGRAAGSQVSGWRPGMLSTAGSAWAPGRSPAAAGHPRGQTVSVRLSVPPPWTPHSPGHGACTWGTLPGG